MAWTTGFFNSVNGDRVYNAEQMSRIFEGLITDGVYSSVGDQMAVQPNNGMTIQIGTGRGWFGHHWVNNDSEYLQVISDADVLMNRYCAVCVQVDDSDEVRNAVPYFKYSEFATDPVKPEMERTETLKEYCLAYIYIKAGATEITAADIEDTRGNTDLCGWVTGLIEQVDTKTLYEQYKADWSQFMEEKTAESDEWTQQEQTDFENWADQEKTDFDAWKLEQQTEFLNWYSNLQITLEGDVAARLTSDVQLLQSEMDTAQADIVMLKNDMASHVIRANGTLNGASWTAQEDGTYLQTITVEGVTASNDVIITPAIENRDKYIEMGVEPAAQEENGIVFKCSEVLEGDIAIEAIIFNFS